MENKRPNPGFLFNKEHSYPVGKCFTDWNEYDKAKAEGWNTGPVDIYRTKLAVEKEPEKPNFFDVEPPIEEKRKPGRPKWKDKK